MLVKIRCWWHKKSKREKISWASFALLIILVLTTVFLPRVWGWEFRWIGTGHATWSMAAENGIMPASILYREKQSGYEIGDIISFDYRGSNDPGENGSSVKMITAINQDGSYRVEGLNKINSIKPHNVFPQDIDGKIVFHQNLVPVTYWRWLSMGWMLGQDDIAQRSDNFYSLRTLTNFFTERGRFWNWVDRSLGDSRAAKTTKVADMLYVSNFGANTWALYSEDRMVLASGNGIAIAGNFGYIAVATQEKVLCIEIETGKMTNSCPFAGDPEAFLCTWKVKELNGSFYVLGKDHVWRMNSTKTKCVGETIPGTNALVIRQGQVYQGNRGDLGSIPEAKIWKPIRVYCPTP